VGGALEADLFLELAKLRLIELGFELRLADQEDLHELLRRDLEVGKQPDLIERGRVQALCLVQYQQRVLPGAPALDQELFEPEKPLGRRVPGLADPEVFEHVLDQRVEGKPAVYHEGDRRVGAEALEQRMDEGRLPGTNLASQDDKALVVLNAAHEIVQGPSMCRGPEEERRVRRQAKRVLLKPVEVEVHGTPSSRPAAANAVFPETNSSGTSSCPAEIFEHPPQ
jgi:hypothetical protein